MGCLLKCVDKQDADGLGEDDGSRVDFQYWRQEWFDGVRKEKVLTYIFQRDYVFGSFFLESIVQDKYVTDDRTLNKTVKKGQNIWRCIG